MEAVHETRQDGGQTAYRAYRDRMLEGCRGRSAGAFHDDIDDERTDDRPEVPRNRIRGFRIAVADALRGQDPTVVTEEDMARRALGIPADIALHPGKGCGWPLLVQVFMPFPWVLRYVRHALSRIRTFEGRQYVYCQFHARLFLHAEARMYSRSLDIALRRFEATSWEELRALQLRDAGWLIAAHRLGLRRLTDLDRCAGRSEAPGWFARWMVDEGIIQHKEELQWLQFAHTAHRAWSVGWRPRRTQREPVRSVVRQLMLAGVARPHLARLHDVDLEESDAARLAANLTLLAGAGIAPVHEVFDSARHLLWRTPTKTWAWVLGAAGACTPADIHTLRGYLGFHAPPPDWIAHHLIARGAGLDALATCCRLLAELSDDAPAEDVEAAIDLLLAAPHCLDFTQLGACGQYLRRPDRLDRFLQVLVRHDLGAAGHVVAFQACYRVGDADRLDAWLTLIAGRTAGMDVDVLVEWVGRMLAQGSLDAFQYLHSAIAPADFAELRKLEVLASLGPGLLRYLVEDKGLDSVKALRDWYFATRGLHGVTWWSGSDPELCRLLADDAFQRHNFGFMMQNHRCVLEVVERRAHQVVPRPQRTVDADAMARYYDALAKRRREEMARLLPQLPAMLEGTGGLLLASVLRAGGTSMTALQDRLARLQPAVEQLLAGQGATSAELDEVDAELISMVYRTSVDVVRGSWAAARGFQSHLDGWRLEPFHPMAWQRSIRKRTGVLERSSLLALKRASEHATRFQHGPDEGPRTFRDVRSKRLRDPARDPWSVSAHLGLLLAAAGNDPEILQWRRSTFSEVASMPEDGAQTSAYLEQLDRLFNSALPDALDEHAQRFLHGLAPDDAGQLLQRLLPPSPSADSTVPVMSLDQAFAQMRKNVLDVCVRWVKREKGRYGRPDPSGSCTHLQATLTKHPAAYFAKHAANLCSRDRVAMWQEARHAHLVVFDPRQRRLAGMAMVNIEVVPSLHASGSCLIIRAINPMEDMLATHCLRSIVESFLDIAIQIAERNDLVAVLMPWHNGAHLLSNLPGIEKYLEKQYLQKAQAASADRSGELMASDDLRRRPRKVKARFSAFEQGMEIVGTLYAIWQRAPVDQAARRTPSEDG